MKGHHCNQFHIIKLNFFKFLLNTLQRYNNDVTWHCIMHNITLHYKYVTSHYTINFKTKVTIKFLLLVTQLIVKIIQTCPLKSLVGLVSIELVRESAKTAWIL